MNAEIQEIAQQLHELRNYLGPVEMLLMNMESQIKMNKADLDRKIAVLESRIEGIIAESRNASLAETAAYPARLAPEVAPPGTED